MAFKFKITQIKRLPGAGVGVIDGTVLAGSVMDGQDVQLVHGTKQLSLRVQGVVMDSMRKASQSSRLSLSVKLRQPAMSLVEVGDFLVAA